MANWRHTVNIKEHFVDDPTDHDAGVIAGSIARQLRRILEKEEGWVEVNHKKALDEGFIWEFEEIVQHFEWVEDAVESGEDATEYSFDNWTEAFNNYLHELYDIGDVQTAEGPTWSQNEKFLWIG